MGRKPQARVLGDRPIGDGDVEPRGVGPVRSVTVNVAESPLGWLLARGLISQRQYDAGDRLRADWERAQLAPRVTMSWDSAPVARGRGGAAPERDLGGAQIDAKRRFNAAIAAAGPGLADILWRVAGARGETGADSRSGPRRGLLPDGLVLAAAAMIGGSARVGNLWPP